MRDGTRNCWPGSLAEVGLHQSQRESFLANLDGLKKHFDATCGAAFSERSSGRWMGKPQQRKKRKEIMRQCLRQQLVVRTTWGVFILFALRLPGCGGTPAAGNGPTNLGGTPAPGFQLVDLNHQTVSLAQFGGMPVIVHLFLYPRYYFVSANCGQNSYCLAPTRFSSTARGDPGDQCRSQRRYANQCHHLFTGTPTPGISELALFVGNALATGADLGNLRCDRGSAWGLDDEPECDESLGGGLCTRSTGKGARSPGWRFSANPTREESAPAASRPLLKALST